jgi:glycerol kinase
MYEKEYIITLDQGTTSSRAIAFDSNAKIIGTAQKEFPQYFPQTAWVEHNPQEIWQSQHEVFEQLLREKNIKPSQVAALGITNQRETTILWDKATGQAIYPAIVWQDCRSSDICEAMKKADLSDYVRENMGLVIDAYFSATKIKWILDNVPNARQRAKNGEILFGTVDTWLLWKLTEGKIHATDYSNASRTMIYNIKTLEWDKKILDYLDIPQEILPEVKSSSDRYGEFKYQGVGIPIHGVIGDQQASLFGQACFEEGDTKNTYGTGCFMLMNIGKIPVISKDKLLTTIAWGLNGKITYALEGSVFIAGAAVQWLRDGLRIINDTSDSSFFAKKVADNNDVVAVPAFVGLGAPYWDMYARGAIFGLTRNTKQEHIIKATLDSVAYRTRDIIEAMEESLSTTTEKTIKTLAVDGGMAANDYLMQFQSDILDVVVERPQILESTAKGAAYLAGLAIGWWTKGEIIIQHRKIERTFKSKISDEERKKLYTQWLKAVERCRNWVD